ncbi:CocE/NonD family hydrolase [Glutamicibacter sp. NPDC087344]|uniref:CocE/NonD family hydrolase n=1 Tax=Glutamicibacter sp. NPDC087344 TaxID=3363994 RepID=UPI003823C9E8
MRDGIELAADVYSPADAGTYPVIILRHPYSRNRRPLLRDVNVMDVVQAGYILVFQDVRGRYGSEGVFEPSVNEIEDGADTVRWSRTLEQSNGTVGMWGSSYAAEAQWSAVQGAPGEISSIIPINSPSHSQFNGFTMRGGAQEFASRLGWGQSSIAFEEFRRAQPDASGEELVGLYARNQELFDSKQIYELRPFSKIHEVEDGFISEVSRIFGQEPGEPWRSLGRTAGKYDLLTDIAVLNYGGWFDCFLGSTLAQYQGLAESAARLGKKSPHLIVGPWSHRESSDRLGDLTFGPQAKAALPGNIGSMTQQIVDWFDATLKGEENKLDAEHPVKLFLMGRNQWLGFETYPPEESKTQEWYLQPDGTLSIDQSIREDVMTYEYDPKNPVPTLGGPVLLPPEFRVGPVDQSSLDSREDILSFSSDVLDSEVHVLGNLSVDLCVSTSAPDTDFVVKLCDLGPDGRSILVADGIQRLSARNMFTEDARYRGTQPQLVQAGEKIQISVDLLGTAYTFAPGHKLRVDITSSNWPRWDANPNTGKTTYESDESEPAQQQVHVGKSQCVVHLPIISDEAISRAAL